MTLFQNPKARANGLVIQELRDEVLIYDLQIDKAYRLNPTSAMVWNLCDGRNSVSDISRQMSKKLKQPVLEDLVYLALSDLKQDNLLANDGAGGMPDKFEGLSRREVIRKVGLASVIALPMIHSIFAPTAAMAQSGGAAPGSRTLGQTCASSTECAASAPNCNGGLCCIGSGGSSSGTIGSGSAVAVSCGAVSNCSAFAATCCSNSATETLCVCTGPLGGPPCTIQCTCN